MQIEPNKEAEFSGVFVAHWEAAGIEVDVGRRLFGLMPHREYWHPDFPSDFDAPLGDIARRFHIRFIGTPSERGQFGHLGMCCRNVGIRQVIEFSEIERDEKTVA
jgi:hypothetical protein